jgi:hypothetical protein
MLYICPCWFCLFVHWHCIHTLIMTSKWSWWTSWSINTWKCTNKNRKMKTLIDCSVFIFGCSLHLRCFSLTMFVVDKVMYALLTFAFPLRSSFLMCRFQLCRASVNVEAFAANRLAALSSRFQPLNSIYTHTRMYMHAQLSSIWRWCTCHNNMIPYQHSYWHWHFECFWNMAENNPINQTSKWVEHNSRTQVCTSFSCRVRVSDRIFYCYCDSWWTFIVGDSLPSWCFRWFIYML